LSLCCNFCHHSNVWLLYLLFLMKFYILFIFSSYSGNVPHFLEGVGGHEIWSLSSVETSSTFLTIYWPCRYHVLHYLYSLPQSGKKNMSMSCQCRIWDSHSVVGEDWSLLVEALCSFEASTAVYQSVCQNISRRIASSCTCLLLLGPHCNIHPCINIIFSFSVTLCSCVRHYFFLHICYIFWQNCPVPQHCKGNVNNNYLSKITYSCVKGWHVCSLFRI